MLTQRQIDRHTDRQTDGHSDSANRQRNSQNTNNVEIGNTIITTIIKRRTTRTTEQRTVETFTLYTFSHMKIFFASFYHYSKRVPPSARGVKHLWDLCLPDMFAFCICDMFENPISAISFSLFIPPSLSLRAWEVQGWSTATRGEWCSLKSTLKNMIKIENYHFNSWKNNCKYLEK